MKLVEFDGAELKVSDEALLVRPIRRLFEADKSRRKETFMRQMSYLWFMTDPRSNYMYLTDEAERARDVKAQEGFEEDWEPSPLLLEAMDVYRRLTVTSSALLLEDMRSGIDMLRSMMRQLKESMEDDGDDGEGKPRKPRMPLDKAMDSMTKVLVKIPELARSLMEAEKALAREYESESQARGSMTKSAYEDI